MTKGNRSFAVISLIMTKIHYGLIMSLRKSLFTHVKSFRDYSLKLCKLLRKKARLIRVARVILRRTKSTATSMKFYMKSHKSKTAKKPKVKRRLLPRKDFKKKAAADSAWM